MHGQVVEVYSLFSPLWVPGTELRSSGSVASTYHGISMVQLIDFQWLIIFLDFLKCSYKTDIFNDNCLYLQWNMSRLLQVGEEWKYSLSHSSDKYVVLKLP